MAGPMKKRINNMKKVKSVFNLLLRFFGPSGCTGVNMKSKLNNQGKLSRHLDNAMQQYSTAIDINYDDKDYYLS